MRRAAITAACALVAGIGLIPAASAEAKPPKNLFGVSSPGHPSAAELQRAARGGVRSVRVQFYWGHVEPTAGAARDWTALDATVARASAAGLRVLPVLYGSPPWAASETAAPPTYSGFSRAAWRSFVADLAARYGSRGAFWGQRPDVPRIPIKQWQLWNEVNLSYFWGSNPNPRRYAQFVKLTSKALRSGDRRSRVILAGVLPFKSITRGSVSGNKYLKRLLRGKKIRRHFQAVAVHPYGKSPKLVLKLLRNTRRQLAKLRVRKPIWVTEFGWSTGGEGWASSPLRATPRNQARRIAKTYGRLRKHSKKLGVKRAYYFSLHDNPGVSSWIGQMGLFSADGTPKPGWYAYARRAGGRP